MAQPTPDTGPLASVRDPSSPLFRLCYNFGLFPVGTLLSVTSTAVVWLRVRARRRSKLILQQQSSEEVEGGIIRSPARPSRFSPLPSHNEPLFDTVVSRFVWSTPSCGLAVMMSSDCM